MAQGPVTLQNGEDVALCRQGLVLEKRDVALFRQIPAHLAEITLDPPQTFGVASQRLQHQVQFFVERAK